MRLLLAALALAAAVGRAAAAAPGPQTLWTTSGPISAFAQDGSAVAWFQPSARACNVVHVRDLASGGEVALPDESANARNVTCRWDIEGAVGLAVARRAGGVVWTLHEQTPLRFDYVLGAGLNDPAERRFQQLAHGTHGAGLWLGGLAGDGDTLVYGATVVDYVNELGCLAGTGTCRMRRVGGGAYRLVGRRPPILVPGTSGTVDVAASAGAIATVPAGAVAKDGRPLPTPHGRIVVRDAETGTAISSVVPRGVALAIALSPHALATLERTALGLRLAWYARDTGAPIGSVPVPRATAPELTANDQVIVFRVGRSIRAVDETTHAIRTLGRAGATPIGLSLEGSRLAWAENVHGRGRIRALYITGRG